MQLIDWLKKSSAYRLHQIADQHEIYYKTNFSKLWIADKIQQKLLDKAYLQKIINQQLNSEDTNIFQQLVAANSLPQTKLPQPTCTQLVKLGLIYEKNGVYYLPTDIKTILTEGETVNPTSEAQLKQSTPNNNSNSAPNVQLKNQAPLSFYDYLLLSLSYLQQTNTPQLTNYLQQINCSPFSASVLKNKILTYAEEFELSTTEKNVTSQLKTWLQTDYRKILLETLAFFFPNRQSILRNITAVLIHYPTSEQLPLNRLNKEVTTLSLSQNDKQLLELLNLFKFTEQNLSLTNFCWQIFNSEGEENFTSPQRKKEKIIVDLPTSRIQLWEICSSQQLKKINKSLVFTGPKN